MGVVVDDHHDMPLKICFSVSNSEIPAAEAHTIVFPKGFPKVIVSSESSFRKLQVTHNYGLQQIV